MPNLEMYIDEKEEAQAVVDNLDMDSASDEPLASETSQKAAAESLQGMKAEKGNAD